jgi:hypothetical protein
MNDSLTLLLTILNLETNDIQKIAVKIPEWHSLLGEYRYYREPDVHEAYSKAIPELNLGRGHVIVDMIEISDVIDWQRSKSMLRKSLD